jgi:ATP synthase protein I
MEKKQSEKEKQPLKSYIKYSSMGFQMVGIIGIFTFIGYKLDQYQQTQTPYYTAGLSLAGIAISLYFVFRTIKE